MKCGGIVGGGGTINIIPSINFHCFVFFLNLSLTKINDQSRHMTYKYYLDYAQEDYSKIGNEKPEEERREVRA